MILGLVDRSSVNVSDCQTQITKMDDSISAVNYQDEVNKVDLYYVCATF